MIITQCPPVASAVAGALDAISHSWVLLSVSGWNEMDLLYLLPLINSPLSTSCFFFSFSRLEHEVKQPLVCSFSVFNHPESSLGLGWSSERRRGRKEVGETKKIERWLMKYRSGGIPSTGAFYSEITEDFSTYSTFACVCMCSVNELVSSRRLREVELIVYLCLHVHTLIFHFPVVQCGARASACEL